MTSALEHEGGSHQGGPSAIPLVAQVAAINDGVAHTLTAPNTQARPVNGKRQDGSRRDRIPIVVAFTSKDDGGDARNDQSPTLRALNFDKSHMNGGGQVAVAFTARGREGGAAIEAQDDLAYALRTPGGGAQRGLVAFAQDMDDEIRELGDLSGAVKTNQSNTMATWLAVNEDPTVVAFTERGRAEGLTLEAQIDLAYTLLSPDGGGKTTSRQIAGDFGVRRLTPRECERLQGFEDDHTAWGIDESGLKVDMADSVRYRMTGNAVNRKVAAWLDSRLIAVAYTEGETP